MAPGGPESHGGADRPGPFASEGELEAARERYAHRLSQHSDMPALDRLAGLAAQLTGSTSAQVSVISDVQTVMAGTGAARASIGHENPAAESLCTVTVQNRGVVRVDDAVHDVRVKDLPPVRSGEVGSYLGVPLVAGVNTVGALCVYNDGPRTWTDQEVAFLEVLAGPIVAELELAALETDYEEERLVWELAVDAGGVGAYDWDLVTGELRWDERLLQLFGVDRQTFGATIEAFNEIVHPDDRDRVARSLSDAVASCGEFEAEYRIRLPDGRVRWIGARGRALPGPDGTAVRVLGAASDTTGAQDAEARVARVLESMPSAFFHVDRQWRFTYANAEAKRLLGGIGVDVIGAVLWELFPDAVGSTFETHYRGAVGTGEPVVFEAYYPPPLDGWYEVRAWPVPDGLSVYFLEISAQREAREVLDRSATRSALLAEVTQALSGTLDSDEAVSRLARLMVPGLGDWCIVTLADGDRGGADWRRGLRDAGWWHSDPDALALVGEYVEVRLSSLRAHSLAARALEDLQPVVLAARAADAILDLIEPGPARDLATRLDPWSAAIVPLTGHDRTVGLLTVFRGRDRETFSPAEVATLEEVAGRAGLALDNARLYQEQRELATDLQQSMMTGPPEPDDLHVAVRYVPAAQAAQVGGDWYDAFLQRSGDTVVVIGDVVGHDTAAAAAMGQLRSILRGIAVTTDAAPAEVLSRVDEAMELLLLDTTATVVVARFERSPDGDGTTRLRWSNAGHPPPLVVTHPAAVPPQPLVMWGEDPDLLLGLLPEFARTEKVMTLQGGSTVLLYTDGLVERRGQELSEGIDELSTVMADLITDGLPLEDLCDELLRRMLPDRPEDDVALVAVRLHRDAD